MRRQTPPFASTEGVRAAPPSWRQTVVVALCVPLAYSVFLLDQATAYRLAIEDGPYEYAGAIAFAAAGVIFLTCYARSRDGNDFLILRTRRNLFFLLLGLLFLFGAGEELSWGQRLLSIETPEMIRKANLQHELNLHNLRIFDDHEDGASKTGLELWLSIRRLFSLFWLGFCMLIPLAASVPGPIDTCLRRLNVPLVPLGLGLAFPLNHGISKLLELFMKGDRALLLWPLIEVKETVFALLFLVLAVWFLRGTRADRLRSSTTTHEYQA